MKSKKKITVVGAGGHIGLPLSVLLANNGFKVIGLDTNQKNIDLINSKKFPYKEENASSQLKKAFKNKNIRFTSKIDDEMKESDFIITVGTPVDEFMNPDLNQLKKCVDSILPVLSHDKIIILRSTVVPGTSEWLKNYLKKKNKSNQIAFCLERVVQGKSFSEIKILPQIIAGTNQYAEKKASYIFKKISKKIIFCSLKEAEFSKLFSNSYRYIQFAIANEFFMIANSAGLDFEKIRKITTDGYPRAVGMPKAGLAAGPCLFKDTMQLMSANKNNFHLGINSVLINEGLVLYIINKLKYRFNLSKLKIGLLGMAFKANSDDVRSSLSYKFKKMLEMSCKEVFCTDPFVKTDLNLKNLSFVLNNSDIIIICAPHDVYKKVSFKRKKIVDIWGICKEGIKVI